MRLDVLVVFPSFLFRVRFPSRDAVALYGWGGGKFTPAFITAAFEVSVVLLVLVRLASIPLDAPYDRGWSVGKSFRGQAGI